jgi:hypothetical protein
LDVLWSYHFIRAKNAAVRASLYLLRRTKHLYVPQISTCSCTTPKVSYKNEF